MERYGKTPGPFKRGKNNKIILGKWSDGTLEYLQDAKFMFTEKLDGTNIRLIYWPACSPYSTPIGEEHVLNSTGHPAYLEIRGRSDNATVHHKLQEWKDSLDIDLFVKAFGDNRVCIYGEGIGDGIQKGGPQYGSTHFRAFAIKGSRGFLPFQVTSEILRHGLYLETAPVMACCTLNEGIKLVQRGVKSVFGNGKFWAEGLIGLPTVPLYTPKRERIIVKLKHRDLYEGDVNASPEANQDVGCA